MPLYIVESYDFSLEHDGHASEGVVPERRGPEKIFLHVLPFTNDEIATFVPRVDEHGNVDHARLAPPREEAFWIAVDGDARWPKIARPLTRSHCDLSSGKPIPVVISADELEALRKARVPLPV